MSRAAVMAMFAGLAFGQTAAPRFEVASVKVSKSIGGHDGEITMKPGRLIVRNSTLKRLIVEAYQVPYSQITGGPVWINRDEYDIDAKAESAVASEQIRLMLRALLADRFKLAVRQETRAGRIYAMTVGKDGPSLDGRRDGSGVHRFRGDLGHFADFLAVQLSIPLLTGSDPMAPSFASGTPVPVVDRTGIAGVHDFSVDIKPDRGDDAFTVWQRALQEQLGLRLESQQGTVGVLIIEHVDRVPVGN